MGEILKGLNLGMSYLLAVMSGYYSYKIYRCMNVSWVCDAGEDIKALHFPDKRRMMPSAIFSCILFSEAAFIFIKMKYMKMNCSMINQMTNHSIVNHMKSSGAASSYIKLLSIPFENLSTFIPVLVWAMVTVITSIMIITVMSVAAQTDCMYMIIPDQTSFFLIPAGVIFNISVLCSEEIAKRFAIGVTENHNLYISLPEFLYAAEKGCIVSISGMAAGFLLLLLCRVISCALSGGEGIGMGDIKLAGACGAVLGFEGILIMLFIASTSSSLFSLVLAACKKRKLSEYHPFGPWLYLSMSLCLIAACAS